MQLRSEDIQLYYEIQGDGFPVVLLHPFPTNHEFWKDVADRLGNRYRLLLPDLRALGRSEVGSGPATMEKHAADLTRLLDATEIRRAAMVGVSIGGYILFEFWRRNRDRVVALVLSNTRAEADSEQGRASRLKSIEGARRHGTAPFIDGQIQNFIGESTRRNRPDIVAKARAMMQSLTIDGLAALQQGMAERPDSTPTLRTIDVNTLVIAGDEDTLTPVANAQLMQRSIPAAKLHVIPSVGHYAAIENPDEFTRVLRQFLHGLQLGG